MGHELLKQHYRIGHIVCVNQKGICIGSPYIHDLIVIGLDGTIIKDATGRKDGDLKRYVDEMKADPETLRKVIAAPDAFEASIPVYTYDGANIIEKLCEKPGWPHTTHDGELMYENSHSTDKMLVVYWAKSNARSGVKHLKSEVDSIKENLAKTEQRLKEFQDNLAKLEAEFPAVMLPPESE